ncbi:hypothetical protein GCM10023196_097220 [Actinoallomurus vinaceus]|uniref:Uncharacterized protein n=1 Tax=Actinoallomurus vinaceus TaxID=1080074 RepID=A0ABP8UTJ7_9ACTN
MLEGGGAVADLENPQVMEATTWPSFVSEDLSAVAQALLGEITPASEPEYCWQAVGHEGQLASLSVGELVRPTSRDVMAGGEGISESDWRHLDWLVSGQAACREPVVAQAVMNLCLLWVNVVHPTG